VSDRDERKRRGIDRAAAQLREQIVKQGGRDPGREAARDRVRDAVTSREKRRE
jgi:hypothetical protein